MRKLLYKFISIILVICSFYGIAWAGLYSEHFPEQLDIMPRETILYDGITQYAEFVYVIRPFDSRRYRLRIGLGCLRALLDPPKGIEMEMRGFGNFWISKKEGYPFLHITTDYHKVMCKITEINPA